MTTTGKRESERSQKFTGANHFQQESAMTNLTDKQSDIVAELRDRAVQEAEFLRKYTDARFGPNYSSTIAEKSLFWRAADELERLREACYRALPYMLETVLNQQAREDITFVRHALSHSATKETTE